MPNLKRFPTHVEDFDPEDLPEDDLARRRELERRSRPSETRPQLAPATEADLAQLEERNAQAYCDAEETTYQFIREAQALAEEE